MKFRFIPHFPWWLQLVPWTFIPIGFGIAFVTHAESLERMAYFMGGFGISVVAWSMVAVADRALRKAAGVRIDPEGLVRVWWRNDMFIFPKEALTTIRVKPKDTLRETWTFIQRTGHEREITLPKMDPPTKKKFYEALKN